MSQLEGENEDDGYVVSRRARSCWLRIRRSSRKLSSEAEGVINFHFRPPIHDLAFDRSSLIRIMRDPEKEQRVLEQISDAAAMELQQHTDVPAESSVDARFQKIMERAGLTEPGDRTDEGGEVV